MWQISPPFLSRAKLQLLLTLLRDPVFNSADVPASTKRFDQLDKLLGTDCKSFTSTALAVERRPAESTEAKTQISPAPRTRIKRVEVPIASLLARIFRLLNDPVRRCGADCLPANRLTRRILICSKLLALRPEAVWAAQGHFWESHFAKEPLLFSDLSAFWIGDKEFRVGDFVEVKACATASCSWTTTAATTTTQRPVAPLQWCSARASCRARRCRPTSSCPRCRLRCRLRTAC
jgi:hypothetical protein